MWVAYRYRFRSALKIKRLRVPELKNLTTMGKFKVKSRREKLKEIYFNRLAECYSVVVSSIFNNVVTGKIIFKTIQFSLVVALDVQGIL